MKVDFNNFIAVGDTAGRFGELFNLLSKFPKDLPVVLLGDLNDRGSQTKELIDFAIDNKDKVYSLQSNHLIYQDDKGSYGINLDTSRGNKLTGASFIWNSDNECYDIDIHSENYYG